MKVKYIAHRKMKKQLKPLFKELDKLEQNCALNDRLEGFRLVENIIKKEIDENPADWLESLKEVGNAEARLLIAVEWLAGKSLISGSHDFLSVEGKLLKSGDDLVYLFHYSLDRLFALGEITDKQRKDAIKELQTERNKGYTIDPKKWPNVPL